jgi:hypothetical protein
MITETGKNILAKYLIGQAPAYASYIAVGCGATPLASDANLAPYVDEWRQKETLDFEMFRVPIISRGYVDDGGVSKIVLTAELPTEERYEITEVGVYSAGSNPSAGSNDSRTVYAFTQTENWEYHDESSATAIPSIYEPLDPDGDNVIEQTSPVFQTNADNRTFTNLARSLRYERSRFLNNIVMMAGNTAEITTGSGGHLEIADGSSHIHFNGISLDFNKNAPTDQLKLAFSVVNKDGSSVAKPSNVKILIDFSVSDAFGGDEFVRFEVDLDDGMGGQESGEHDFGSNRYVVVTKELQDLYKSSAFSWNSVNVVKIYTCVTYNDAPSDNFYVALDSLRLENVTSVNPLYGLTGYSVIKNTDSQTIIKRSNTTNFIEFRFALDVA